jgi:hypothetical protein
VWPDNTNNTTKFPEWALGIYERYPRLFKEAVVYYDDGDNLNDVKKLATERELVNIAMGEDGLGYNLYCFNKLTYDIIKRYWDEGYYGRYYKKNREIAPNIAIYCRTPIRYRGKEELIKCINVMGYAFDNPRQPDYKYFVNKHGDLDTDELYHHICKVFRKIFCCALEKRCSRIILCRFGCTNFCGDFCDDVNDIYDDALYRVLQDMGKDLSRNNINEISCLKENLSHIIRQFNFDSFNYTGKIPKMIFEDRHLRDLRNTLFVNAWDPWSMVGNGNGADHSLDGFFGNSTAMAILCWPLTNPDIKYQHC